MLMEVGAFCDRVRKAPEGLIGELQDLTGRYGECEEDAWYSSLAQVAEVLDRPQLAEFRAYHLHLGQRGHMSVEYRLPASASWCDVVLLGKNGRPSAVILELKDWDTASDSPGPSEALIEHRGDDHLHPADQVRGYVEYCQRFHSAVLDHSATVAGCVYFTRPVATSAYVSAPHEALTSQYPVFSSVRRDANDRFPAFLREHLRKPDARFALRFEEGTYKQDRAFCAQVARQIEDPAATPFVLLDGQRLGFEVCRRRIREALDRQADRSRKLVVLIEGPPGSGKSVVAARLWADMAKDPAIPGNVVVTTTSSSQSSNWQRLFAEAGGGRGGHGLVKKANNYAPETTNWVGRQRKKDGKGAMSPDAWRKNLEICRKQVGRLRSADDTYTVSIVDEAHALINPEEKKARPGVSGWPTAFGPQAYHVMRSSRVSVFLMDGEQGYRDRETTTAKQIAVWARELGGEVAPTISLTDTQFRLAGAAEYMDWLDRLLERRTDVPSRPLRWRRTDADAVGKLTFEVLDHPQAVEAALRRHATSSVRLLASYGRPWKTKLVRRPHELPGDAMDFDIPGQGTEERWAKIWNYAPKADYTLFVQAPPGSRMDQDPLAEVGCPYVVRGFDWDYVGVLWLKDLVWRDGWKADLEHVHESGISQTRAAARREGEKPGQATAELVTRLQQAYRILLSRAIKGVYLWFEDEATKTHIMEALNGRQGV